MLIVDLINLSIRDAKLADLAEVNRIEKENYVFPWSEMVLRETFERNNTFQILTCGDEILGYLITQDVIDERHILNVSIDKKYQKQGLGYYLIEKCIQDAKVKEVKVLFLEVRVSNQKAIDLYYAIGFKEIATRKDYYQGTNGREDALVMSFKIS